MGCKHRFRRTRHRTRCFCLPQKLSAGIFAGKLFRYAARRGYCGAPIKGAPASAHWAPLSAFCLRKAARPLWVSTRSKPLRVLATVGHALRTRAARFAAVVRLGPAPFGCTSSAPQKAPSYCKGKTSASRPCKRSAFCAPPSVSPPRFARRGGLYFRAPLPHAGQQASRPLRVRLLVF